MIASLRFVFIAIAILAVAAATATAQVQGRGQGNRLGGDLPNDPAYLLDSDSVQNELALTDDQKTRLQKIRDEDKNSGPAFYRNFIGLSPEQIQTKLNQRAIVVRRRIAKVLTPEQIERLNEINIQAAGAAALSYDDVGKKLKLSAPQREQLNKLGEESRSKLAGLYSPVNGQPLGNLTPQLLDEKRNEIRAERNDKSLALLTDDQRAAFDKLRGAKFDISTIKPRQRNYTSRGRIGPPPGFAPPGRPGA